MALRPRLFSSILASALALMASSARGDVTKEACIRANASAQSLRREGKLGGAREQLQICLNPGCPRVVRDDCAQRLDEIERVEPSVVFDVKDTKGADVAGVRVTVDGRALAEKLDGTALAVDPGEHSFTFEIAGQPAITRSFIIKEGEKERRERIAIGVAPPEPPQPAANPPPQPASPLSPSSEAAGGHWGTRRTVGIVLGGAGVAAAVAGGVFGLLASGDWNLSQQACTTPTQCIDHGQAVIDHDRAVRDAMFSDIGFVAGGVLVAAGAVLFLTAPSREATPSASSARVVLLPDARPARIGVSIQGLF